MEDFDEVFKNFWKPRRADGTGYWRISTEIIQLGNDRWIKATIHYGQNALITAHSEDFELGKVNEAEKQAIQRAIELLPPYEP